MLPEGASSPSGIAAGADGNLWFTETERGRLARITPDGAIDEWPLPGSRPTEITGGPDGNIWLIYENAPKIVRATITGRRAPPHPIR